MKKFAILLALSLAFLTAFATHQRSGEITYRRISGSLTYEFTIVTYTFSPSLADRCELVINYGDGNSETIPRVNGPPGTTPAGSFCNHTGEIIAPLVRKNVYVGTHTFAGPGTFIISVEDPNRNAGIINIPNSVDVPFYVQSVLVLNPFLGVNNSVQLLLPPIDNACVGYTYIHNTGAWDPDGDSLSFRLVDCRGFNGQPIAGYTLPIASDSIVIDPINGDLIWHTPVIQGEYNVAIEITEWRNGFEIGKVTRDLQILVGTCENNPNPPVISTIADTCVVVGDTLRFRVVATDADGDRITLTGVGEPLLLSENPASFLQPVDSIARVTSYFSWAPNCNHVRKDDYIMYFKAQDNGTPVNLIDLKRTYIRVIAPPPENLTAVSMGRNISLAWDNSSCENISGYYVYRRIGTSTFEPGNCVTGVPDDAGFTLISGSTPWPTNQFLDDNQGQGLTQGNLYCYLVVAVFPDGSESIASNQACASLKRDLPVITNVSVLETDATLGSMYVAWSKPTELDLNQTPGPFIYMVKRRTGTEPWNVIDSFTDLNDTIFIDYNLNTLSNPYAYQIDFINDTPGNNFLIGSSQPAISMFLQLQPDDERMNLNWNVNVPWINDSYVIYRKNDETGIFDSIDISNVNSYTDLGLLNGQTYCYKIKSRGNYTDQGYVSPIINFSQENCGSPSDLTPPCPPLLEVTTDCDLLENKLIWTNTDNYCPDTDDTHKYYIWYRLKPTDNFTLLDSTLTATDTTYIHRLSLSIAGCYAVTAVDVNNNMSDFSNEECVDSDACPLYTLPNVFTPNGDGFNDYWIPFPYVGVESISLIVVNRWGRRVFETRNPDVKWDGRDMDTNMDCPDGVYFYVCDVFEITLEGNRQRTIQGSVHILR